MALITIHPSLMRFTDNQNHIELSISSVAQIIASLCQAHPKLKTTILDAQGELSPFVNIYLNKKNIKQCVPNLPVQTEDQIDIMTALVGG